jgi:hypothetical protein
MPPSPIKIRGIGFDLEPTARGTKSQFETNVLKSLSSSDIKIDSHGKFQQRIRTNEPQGIMDKLDFGFKTYAPDVKPTSYIEAKPQDYVLYGTLEGGEFKPFRRNKLDKLFIKDKGGQIGTLSRTRTSSIEYRPSEYGKLDVNFKDLIKKPDIRPKQDYLRPLTPQTRGKTNTNFNDLSLSSPNNFLKTELTFSGGRGGSRNNNDLKSFYDFDPDYKPDFSIKTSPTPDYTPRADFAPDVTTTTKTDVRTDYTPDLTPRYTPDYTPDYKPDFTPDLTPSLPSFSKRGKPLFSNRKGFDVFVRKAGKFEKINLGGALTKAQALSLGVRATDFKAAATFKIKPSFSPVVRGRGSSYDNFRLTNQYYKKLDRGETLFIEKSKYRISTLGEIQEISYKGLNTKWLKNFKL